MYHSHTIARPRASGAVFEGQCKSVLFLLGLLVFRIVLCCGGWIALKVSLELIESFLKEKNASDKCPFCPNEDWLILAPLKEGTKEQEFDPYLVSLPVRMGEPKMVGALDLIFLSCSNCGFVREIPVFMFQQWLDSKKGMP